MTKSNPKKLMNKKVLIPVILGAGVLLSAIFLASPFVYTWAQLQQQTVTNNTQMREERGIAIPQINGSISVGDNIQNFLKENAKLSFVAAAETAQDQITNGTVLEGHLGVTQGYLTYTYFVVDPTKETTHKVIIDAGNGQILHTSEGRPIGSLDQQTFGLLGPWKGHGFGGPWHHGFGGPWHHGFGGP
jgi:uncharacterized membrane protein YkoI